MSRSLKIVIYLGTWLVLLLVLSLQSSWGIEIPFLQAGVRIIRDWGPWILLGPILWWLVKRFPVFGERKLRNIGVHVLVSILMMGVAETLVAFVVYPATQPIAESSGVSTRDLMRSLRGERVRPAARIQEYRFRSRVFGRKVQIWFLLYWVFVLIGTAVIQRGVAEERTRRALILKNDLTQARYRELQSRINPHFLFNVLNSINALIPIDPKKAEEMVSQLSALLRRILASSEQTLIPLSEELSLLRDYLSIEQVRFSDRLQFEEHIDEKLSEGLIPPLTLQPIAENAIKHGIEPKSEPSVLRIVARQKEEKRIELLIEDDGIGFTQPGEGDGLGMGLQSVRERLENAFPGQSRLSVLQPEEGGTQVEIVIPFVKGETS